VTTLLLTQSSQWRPASGCRRDSRGSRKRSRRRRSLESNPTRATAISWFMKASGRRGRDLWGRLRYVVARHCWERTGTTASVRLPHATVQRSGEPQFVQSAVRCRCQWEPRLSCDPRAVQRGRHRRRNSVQHRWRPHSRGPRSILSRGDSHLGPGAESDA